MPLILMCAAMLGGLAVGDVGRLDTTRLVFAGVLGVLGASFAWRRPAWRFAALLALAAALGALRACLVPADDATALEAYLGLAVRLRGVVVQLPSSSQAATQLLVDVHAIGPAGRDPVPIQSESRGQPPRPPSVRLVADPSVFGDVDSGQVVILEGRLNASDTPAGPPTLVFPQLLDRQPQPASPSAMPAFASAMLAGARTGAGAAIVGALPEPQASLAAGVLLGGTGHLDADFRLQLQRSGLAHVVAIDGFKQVVVAGLLGGTAVRLLGPKLAAVPVLLGICAYTLVTGAHPAAVRAGLMVGLATLAALTGRVADPLTSVLVATTTMAIVHPRVLLDVGLQLSLSATLGIVLLWPRLRRRFRGVPRVVAEPVGLTLAVTLASLPVTLSAFQLVSLVSPVAHVLALPLLPLILLSTALLVCLSPLPVLVPAAAWLAWLPSTLLVHIVRIFGSLPGAALSTGRLPSVAAMGLAAGLLVWGLQGLPEASRLRRRARTRIEAGDMAILGELAHAKRFARLRLIAACLTACLACVGLTQLVRPDGRLHVQKLPQARGEAVFIRGPTGRTTLVVGGRLDARSLAAQVADCLAVWEHSLSAVLQVDATAQAGLGLTLARYPPEQRLDAAADGRVDLGGGAVLDVYAPADQASPGVSISFGRVWLPVAGHPPPPIDATEAAGGQAAQNAVDLVSDGIEVWTADAAAQVAQIPVATQLR